MAPVALKSWQTPRLEALGSVVAVTAGPKSGTIDLLGGATGGFLDPPAPPAAS